MLIIPMSIKLFSLSLIMSIIEGITDDLDFSIDDYKGEYQIRLSPIHFNTINNQFNLITQYGARYVSAII
jgi:hypothetical protein